VRSDAPDNTAGVASWGQFYQVGDRMIAADFVGPAGRPRRPLRLHESLKVELETYARQTEQQIVKPFVLVIARDTSHVTQLLELVQGNKFLGHGDGTQLQGPAD